jgi:hypothetical protein
VIGNCWAERDHEFNLVMQVIGDAGVGDVRILNDGVGRFHEKNGLAFRRLRAHFPRVLGEVPSDAVNAVNRKALRAAGDADAGLIRRRECIVRHEGFLKNPV